MARLTLGVGCWWLVLGVSTPASAQDAIAWRFKEGETLRYSTAMKMKQSMSLMGNDVNVDMDMKTATDAIVKKTSAGGPTTIEQKIVEMSGTMNGPMGNVDMEEQLKALVGASYSVVLGPNGEVIEIKGLKEFLERAIGDNPVAGQMISAMMQEDNLKQQVASNFSFVPRKPVVKGDSWEQKASMPLGPMGKFLVDLKFTYAGMEKVDGKDLAKIDFVGKLKHEAGKPDDNAPFQVTQADFKSTSMSGTYYFDPAAGRLSHTTSKVSMQGDLTISVAGNAVPMSFKQDIEQTTRVTVKSPTQ